MSIVYQAIFALLKEYPKLFELILLLSNRLFLVAGVEPSFHEIGAPPREIGITALSKSSI